MFVKVEEDVLYPTRCEKRWKGFLWVCRTKVWRGKWGLGGSNGGDDEVDSVNHDGNTPNVQHHWAQSQYEKPLKIHLVAWGLLIKSFFKKENRSHQVPGYNKNIRRIRNNKKYNLENDEPTTAKRLSSRTRKINLENDQSPQIWHPCAFSFGSIDVHQLLHAGNQGLAVLNDHCHPFDNHHHLNSHHHLSHHHHHLCHHYYIFFVIITRVIINSTFFETFSWSSFPAEFWIPKEIRWRRACVIILNKG